MKRSGLIAMIALTLLPLVMTGLAVLFVLPDTIPLHAGAGGVDRVGSKFGAFEISSFLVGFGVLATILTRSWTSWPRNIKATRTADASCSCSPSPS